MTAGRAGSAASVAAASRGGAIGVDIGGTKVLGVALGTDGAVVHEARCPTPQVPGPAGAEVARAVASVVTELDAAVGRDAGCGDGWPVGVGAPGMVDWAGVLCFAPNLQVAAGAHLGELVAGLLPGRSVVVENDANCALWAEHVMGAARGADHVLLVTLGTGIGGGMISHGQLLRGAGGFAGELGHLVVDPDGPLCPCGRRGCWERYASGGGLGRLAREAAVAGRLPDLVQAAGGDPEDVHGEHVSMAAAAGDPQALAVIDELGHWVALGLANLVAVLDPERIVIGGGLTSAEPVLLAPTRRAFRTMVEGGDVRPDIPIVAARFGEQAGAVGAALLAASGSDAP